MNPPGKNKFSARPGRALLFLTTLLLVWGLCGVPGAAQPQSEPNGEASLTTGAPENPGPGFDPPQARGGEARAKIAVLLSYAQAGRWEKDLAAMRDFAAARDIDLLVEVSPGNQMLQNNQAAKLLAQNPSVLVLAPHDAAGAASIVRRARAQGVRVIAYDRLVLNAGVDLYISYDSEKVGELQGGYLARRAPAGAYVLLSGSPTDHNALLLWQGAMKALQPLIDSGAITVAADGPVIDWEPATARDIVEAALNRGVKLAAVLAPNDSTAAGAVQALNRAGLGGRVLVTGQDATVDAVQRLILGSQSMTVYKNTRLMAGRALELALMMARGEPWEDEVPERINDGGRLVPAIMLSPVLVDQNNIDSVLISGGHLSREEIYGREGGLSRGQNR